MNENNERDDQLVAALCHASILMPLIGVTVPLAIWLSQRQRSEVLRFQALQALAYQLVALLAYFVINMCQTGGALAFIPVMLLTSLTTGSEIPGAEPEPPAIFAIFILIFIGVMMLSTTLMCLGGPVYLILGLVAAFRVLSGRDFRYPILGKWIARRLNLDPAKIGEQ